METASYSVKGPYSPPTSPHGHRQSGTLITKALTHLFICKDRSSSEDTKEIPQRQNQVPKQLVYKDKDRTRAHIGHVCIRPSSIFTSLYDEQWSDARSSSADTATISKP